MNKREIVGMFLKEGVLLSPEDFETVNEKNYMEILRSKKGPGKKDEYIVIGPRRGEISSKDFIKIYNKKFEFLREILLKKTDAVSINKGRKIFSEVMIIGRVKEMTIKGFVMEDVTGETEVIAENKDTETGDVLGMKGYFKENCFHPKQTIWPDVPLDNTPKPINLSITLTPKTKETLEKKDGLVICPNAKPSENMITNFDKFALMKISKNGKEIKVIAYSPSKEIKDDEAVKMLKKRMIPQEGILDNLITEIPDILWIFNNKRNWTKNYKGVVIISSDENSFAEYLGEKVKFGKI